MKTLEVLRAVTGWVRDVEEIKITIAALTPFAVRKIGSTEERMVEKFELSDDYDTVVTLYTVDDEEPLNADEYEVADPRSKPH